jgi:hypothetical protein
MHVTCTVHSLVCTHWMDARLVLSTAAGQCVHEGGKLKPLACTQSAGSRNLKPSRGGLLQAVTKRRNAFCCSGVKPSSTCATVLRLQSTAPQSSKQFHCALSSIGVRRAQTTICRPRPRPHLPELHDDGMFCMVSTSVVHMLLHVLQIEPLMVPTSYQSLHRSHA